MVAWPAAASGGIVCALEFRVFPVAEVYGGALLFPIGRAADVFAGDLDERATTCVRLLRLPPLPEPPDMLRGQSFAVVDGARPAGFIKGRRLSMSMRQDLVRYLKVGKRGGAVSCTERS